MANYFLMSLKNTYNVWKVHLDMLRARRRYRRQYRKVKLQYKLWKFKTIQEAFKNL